MTTKGSDAGTLLSIVPHAVAVVLLQGKGHAADAIVVIEAELWRRFAFAPSLLNSRDRR